MKAIKNIIKVISGNITTIISGIVVSFLLPKIISVSDYGFYKIFTLYFNYLGVLSLGIIDGIVLKYGDKGYDELNRQRFRSYFAWYSILHMVFAGVILLIAFILGSADHQFVILILAANLYPANVTGYFQQISQITQRFNEYTVRRVLYSVCNIALVLLMFVLYTGNVMSVTYRVYLIGLLVVNAVLMGWYIFTYRDIVFGKRDKLMATARDILLLIKTGFPLLLANLCSTLLLSLDRQLVSMFFSTEEYATYAFAYSMLSLITVATSAIATVVYPIFKRVSRKMLSDQFKNIQAALLSMVFLIILVYFPLSYFLEFYLPDYVYSLSIFRIILPGLAISSCITVVMYNYYKTFDMASEIFSKSIVALIVSFILTVTAYLIFSTREAISMASVLALLVWYIHVGWGMRKICGIDKRSFIYMLVMGGTFYLFTSIEPYWIGGVSYLIFFALFSCLYYKKNYNEIIMFLKTSKI